MRWGRLVSSCAASLAVAGCAVVVVGINQAASKPIAAPTPTPTSTPTYRPALPSSATVPVPVLPVDPGEPATTAAPRLTPTTPALTRTAATSTSAAPRSAAASVRPAPRSTTVARPATHRPAPRATTPRATTHRAAPRPVPAHRVAPRAAPAARGGSLPLGSYTGSATRVITVVASSHGSTSATLQAWTRAPGGGWWRYGSAVTAHVGADGLSTAASEYRSATPIGSFSLTQAFGHYSDPGTALPYTHTNSHYWWVSDTRSSLYNTMQYCHPGCSFAHSPNEHLYYETPYYNYAVVIDYNRFPKPVAPRGSAFFLHVTDGHATAGCVSISQSKLLSLMRWLTPTARPRILIGVS